MNNILKRWVSVFLVVCMSISVTTLSASAIAVNPATVLKALEGITTAAGAVKALADATSSTTEMVQTIKNFLSGDANDDSCEWLASSYFIGASMNRIETTKDVIHYLAQDWNTNWAAKTGFQVDPVTVQLDDGTTYIALRCRFRSGAGRFEHSTLAYYLCDGNGRILCSNDTSETDGHWGPRSSITLGTFRMLSYEDIYNLAHDVGGELRHSGDHWFIYEAEHGAQVYCNSAGLPFASPYSPSALDTPRPSTGVTDEEGNAVDIGGEVNLDMLNGLLTLFGDVYSIDQLLYDEGNKTYYVDASTTVNVTNNYYFKWEYHINHTSITYIGQTEQYEKYYEVYYELPDGRDSADLTKEELEQLNVAMDVIPYGRSADNTNLRSLYHFDGDTKDSSYWNYLTTFDWTDGASLTYMDAGAFNGALYLDEGRHQFSVKLPSPVYTDNFTVQFRYYQSHTLAPVTDASIRFSSTGSGAGRFDLLLSLDGANMYDMNGDALSRIPTGTWNEIAVTRYRYKTYYYLNGVCVGEVTDRTSYGQQLTFIFGDQQQTYKYFDELRILNHALSDEGNDYTPTSVPHDTNLSLVLPTDAVPVADEYWDFNAEGNVLTKQDFTFYDEWQNWAYADNSELNQNYYSSGQFADGKGFDKWVFRSAGSLSLEQNDGYISIVNSSSSAGALLQKVNDTTLSLLLASFNSSGLANQGTAYSVVPNGTYTFTVMLADGTLYSMPFTVQANYSVKPTTGAKVDFPNGGYMAFIMAGESGNKALGSVIVLCPPKKGQLDIAYMELVEGGTPNTGHEFIESVTVIDKEDIDKATLAVRTDIPITKYYIGGVRPSLPHKGYVWALVENQRIKSLQVYNGQAWEAVDGRIWTGQRWVPYSSYNIITMQDLFDVQDATQDFEYIYTEQGFWDWWQKSWNEFTAKLFGLLGSGSNSPEKLPTDGTEDPESSGQKFTHFIVVLRDGFWSICVGLANAVYGGFEGFADSVSTVGSFFTAYGDGDESIWLLPLEEGVSVWD